MADLGLLSYLFDCRTPEEVQAKIVELLFDEGAALTPEVRRDLADMLRGGFDGFRLTVSRLKAYRPPTDTLRNVAIYSAINEARYLKRVGERSDLPMEWREKTPLSEAQWREIVDRLISGHNAVCSPEDRWTPLNDQKAREQAFTRGYKAAMAYQQTREEADGDG
jgi:hypothetical protein